MKAILSTLFILLTSAASAAAQARAPEIVARSTEVAAALKAGDAAKVASFYTDDAVLMDQDQPMIKGRAAIQQSFEQGVKQGLSDVRSQMVDAAVSGDLGYAVYTVQVPMRNAAGEQLRIANGKDIEIWKRVRGQWLIAYDMFNDDERVSAPTK